MISLGACPPHGAAGCAHWWAALQAPSAAGDRAKLRRAATLAKVGKQPAAQQLRGLLPDQALVRVWTVAGVLAWVRMDVASPLPFLLGCPRGAPAMKRVMFRRLLQTTEQERMTRLRYALGYTSRHAHVLHLAQSMLAWGQAVGAEWTEQYDASEVIPSPLLRGCARISDEDVEGPSPP